MCDIHSIAFFGGGGIYWLLSWYWLQIFLFL